MLPEMNQWPQIVFSTNASHAQLLEDALFASGALSVMYQDEHDQPILEPAPGEVRLWENIRLIGLYPRENLIDDIVSRLSLAFAATASCGLPAHEWIPLADQQWERAWMDDFQPMQFGPTLWICPSHCQPVNPAVVNVRLDPGLAFGTGTHATTRQCLEWLGKACIREKTIIDYGCGSGVLAVAAALLGAKHVIAVDIDPQAIDATQHNAQNNDVSASLTIGLPDKTNGLQVDIVVANILFQPLISLASDIAGMVLPGGSLVLSGVLDSQVDELMLHYNQWFTFDIHTQQSGWALLHATRLHQA